MASYGFKMFRLELVKRDGRTPQAWSYKDKDKRDVHRIDLVREILNDHMELVERGLPLTADARPLTDAERKARPVFQVERVEHFGSNTFVEFRYGRHRDEDKGLPATEGSGTEGVDLTDIAPTRRYRIGIFPPTTGTKGMLVVEAISGACPSKYFIRWMRRWAQDHATTHGDSQDWHKLWAHAAIDQEILRGYLRQAEADKIFLVQREVKSSRTRESERFRLEAAVLSNQSDAVLQRVQEAITSEVSEDNADKQFASDLGDILGHGVDELEVDDGWVVLDVPSVGRQQVSPTRVPEIFVYPIDNERPDDTRFRYETKVAALRLAPSLGATIDLTAW